MIVEYRKGRRGRQRLLVAATHSFSVRAETAERAAAWELMAVSSDGSKVVASFSKAQGVALIASLERWLKADEAVVGS